MPSQTTGLISLHQFLAQLRRKYVSLPQADSQTELMTLKKTQLLSFKEKYSG